MDDSTRQIADGESAAFDPHLRRRTRKSIFWTTGQTAGDQLFSFFVFVVLARLLDKEAIGTFAIAFVLTDIGRAFAAAGVMQRVARLKALTNRDLDTIFWANMLLSAGYAALMFAAAPAAETLFHAPQLGECLRWLAATVIISEAGNTHMALRLREFGHKTLAVRSIVGGIVSGTCAVIMALLGAGIWALVAQRIVRDVVVTVLSWTSYRWRPGFLVDLQEGRKCLLDAVQLGLAQVVTKLSLRAQDIGVARVLGPIRLSSYRVAWRCGELIGPQVVGPFATVALQTFSQLRDRRGQLRTAYISMLQHCALASIPALVGYAVAGPWIVPALFGPQWTDAGRIAPMFLPLALPFTITPFALSLFAAEGRISWQRHIAMLDLLTTVLVTWFAVPHGLRALALAYSVRSLALLPIQVFLVRRLSGIGIQDHLKALAAPIAAATVMAGATAILFNVVHPDRLLSVTLLCAASAAIYAATVAIIAPQYRKSLRQLMG
jgi:O-antigen/teichoic acid export membrane protein